MCTSSRYIITEKKNYLVVGKYYHLNVIDVKLNRKRIVVNKIVIIQVLVITIILIIQVLQVMVIITIIQVMIIGGTNNGNNSTNNGNNSTTNSSNNRPYIRPNNSTDGNANDST